MLCNNCGATYGDKEVKCPYCGHENGQVAMQFEQAQIRDMYGRVNNITNNSVRQVRHTTKVVVAIAIAIVAMFAIYMIVMMATSEQRSMKRYENQKENLARLEEMYQKKDYDGMDDLLDKINDSYKSIYDKYSYTVDIIEDIEYVEKDAATLKLRSTGEDSDYMTLNYNFYFAYSALDSIKRFEDLGYSYGEEETIKGYRDRVYTVLKGTYKLTEEEIEKGAKINDDEVDNYKELSKLSYNRMISEISDK